VAVVLVLHLPACCCLGPAVMVPACLVLDSCCLGETGAWRGGLWWFWCCIFRPGAASAGLVRHCCLPTAPSSSVQTLHRCSLHAVRNQQHTCLVLHTWCCTDVAYMPVMQPVAHLPGALRNQWPTCLVRCAPQLRLTVPCCTHKHSMLLCHVPPV
jgi:hypothetical protein